MIECEPEFKTSRIRVPAVEISVKEAGGFPVRRSVSWELDGRPQTNQGNLLMSSPVECTVSVCAAGAR